ncbi:protein root hair defective 3, partial [Tanacetum coccineum]
PVNKCYSTQFVDEHGALCADTLDNFIKQVGLGEYGLSYVVVAIMGPQSSGKSTLLNHLFKTNFREMHAEDGRHFLSSDVRPPEDDTAFEKQTGAMILGVSIVTFENFRILNDDFTL